MAIKINGTVVFDDNANLQGLNESFAGLTQVDTTGGGEFREYLGSYLDISSGKPRLHLVEKFYNCDVVTVNCNCNCASNCNCDCRC